MKATINGTELNGIVKMEVGLLREPDRNGIVQALLGTPEFRIVREITNQGNAEIAALASFADVTMPAAVELEFTSNNDSIVEVELTDVMIDAPELDFQPGRLIEVINGRAGTLELTKPPGEKYTRDIPLYPNSD